MKFIYKLSILKISILVLIISILLSSCNNKNINKNYATVSIDIDSTSTYRSMTKQFQMILEGPNLKKEISSKYPSFSSTDTLYVKNDGIYTDAIRDASIFLTKNGDIKGTISRDKENNVEKNKITYSKDYSEENNFLEKFNKEKLKMTLIEMDLMSSNEKVFLSKIDSFLLIKKNLLEEYKSKFKYPNFYEIVKKSIDFDKDYYCSLFEYGHKVMTGDKDFKVSDDFPTKYNNINLEDTTMFYFSNSYRNLLDYTIKKETLGESDEDKRISIILNNLDKIKNPEIKNWLAVNIGINLLNNSNNKLQEIYNTIIPYIIDNTQKKEIEEIYNKNKIIQKGNPSPKFTSYEDINGKKVSLDDFKGTNVFIDIWATWCAPCRSEIPFLLKLEKKYNKRNIKFVSISVDKDKDAWQKFVKSNNLKGIQLISDKYFESSFIKDYDIQNIPRFILIDKNGNIVSSDAPAPSLEKDIEELFKTLNL